MSGRSLTEIYSRDLSYSLERLTIASLHSSKCCLSRLLMKVVRLALRFPHMSCNCLICFTNSRQILTLEHPEGGHRYVRSSINLRLYSSACAVRAELRDFDAELPLWLVSTEDGGSCAVGIDSSVIFRGADGGASLARKFSTKASASKSLSYLFAINHYFLGFNIHLDYSIGRFHYYTPRAVRAYSWSPDNRFAFRSEQHIPLDIGRSIIPKLINWMWRRMCLG